MPGVRGPAPPAELRSLRTALPWLALAGAVLATACAVQSPVPVASTPRVGVSGHGAPQTSIPARPTPLPTPRALAGEGAFAVLAGWDEEDHAEALRAFQAGCGAAREAVMRQACLRARALPTGTPDGAARQFFEFNFVPVPLAGEGVLTAYFAPEYPARRGPEGAFTAPVRPRPTAGVVIAAAPGPPPLVEADPDPVESLLAASAAPAPATPLAAADRRAIEAAPATDALAWMRPEDLFFLQVQGSGTLVFADGARLKALYAGDNGRVFTPIARAMVRAGDLAPQRAGADAIRGWLAAHAGAQAQAVMDLDARYVFFRLAPDDGRDPAGAAGVPLPPGRSLAVDPSRHGYGELYWIDASAPVLTGATRRYRRLALALDTGSAIRGDIRADLYTGRGDAAGVEAGRVRHTLRLVRLVPVAAPGR